jgi:hypothetical protein
MSLKGPYYRIIEESLDDGLYSILSGAAGDSQRSAG